MGKKHFALVDATGDPMGESNAPKTEFEKEAARAVNSAQFSQCFVKMHTTGQLSIEMADCFGRHCTQCCRWHRHFNFQIALDILAHFGDFCGQ